MAEGNHVFISYAKEDAPFARTVRTKLKKLKLTPWQDVHELTGGQEWRPGLDDALRNAAAVVVIVSPHSHRSRWVNYEWAFALGAGVPVVPLLKSSTRPHPRLRDIQYVDFGQPNPWLRLLKALLDSRQARRVKQPVIRAEFSLEDGVPEKVEDEYVIDLWIDNVPLGASRARYEVHHESFKQARWTEKNPRGRFRTYMQSSGDVLLTADIETPSQVVLADTMLYEALRTTYGGSRNEAIRKALLKIENN